MIARPGEGHKSNRGMDNPTNISPLDCSKAVRLLRTANAQFIMDLIEGENKFGKICAEVKSSLMELKAA